MAIEYFRQTTLKPHCLASIAVENLSVLLADLDMSDWQSIVRHAVTTTDAFVIAMEGNHPVSAMYDLKENGIRLCLRKPSSTTICELRSVEI